MNSPEFRQAGFTTVELIVVVSILGILMVLTAPTIWSARNRVGKVVCASHLRSLHCSFGAYLNDNELWPQCPEGLDEPGEDQFWIDSLKDYGAPESVWKCPSLVQRTDNMHNSEAHKIHYTPTEFDDNPMSPRRWIAMPWLIEISDVHGGGNLLIHGDGSVESVYSAFQKNFVH